MAPQLQILSNVLQRIENTGTTGSGCLYGIMYNDTLVVLTFSINAYDSKNLIDCAMLQLNLPADIHFCGILHIDETERIYSDVFKDFDITDNPLLLRYSHNTSEVETYFYVHEKLETVNNVSIISEDDLSRQFAYIRLRATLPLIAQNENILEALQELRKNLASGKIGIHFPSNNTYLFRTDDSKDAVLRDILPISKDHEGSLKFFKESIQESYPCPKILKKFGDSLRKESKNINCYVGTVVYFNFRYFRLYTDYSRSISLMFFTYRLNLQDIINAYMLLKISGENNSEESIGYAPVLQCIKKSFDSLECNLHIDTLSLVRLSAKSVEVHTTLVESVCRNIKLIEMFQQNKPDKIELFTQLPDIMHFKPQGCGHLFTVIYPNNFTNDNTMEYRKALQKALALDLTRPYFRRGNAIKLDIQKNEKLLNPHEAVLYKDVTGKLSVVYGMYAYHHYMQDNLDDNGWGCAYRSLQTIISWYRLQGYTDIPIPTHREIQQCLVNIGDKPLTFVGSKQWIGSTEVNFVLSTLLNIDAKILCASNGEEMPTLIPQLANHFDTHGTPVMIGGGTLAHTILGVSYKEDSGEGKFLILDPHYVGADHLPTVTSKGWCAWKTKDFWKKDAFYNMCLPQRPVTF